MRRMLGIILKSAGSSKIFNVSNKLFMYNAEKITECLFHYISVIVANVEYLGNLEYLKISAITIALPSDTRRKQCISSLLKAKIPVGPTWFLFL